MTDNLTTSNPWDSDTSPTDQFGRYYSYCGEIDDIPSDSDVWDSTHYEKALKGKANLLSSECEDGMHRPVIDFDIPVRYVPSTTEGHGHLYIDKPVEWEKYVKLLDALLDCGFIQPGFHKFSLQRHASFVRPPWIKKGDSKKVNEAELRSERYHDSKIDSTIFGKIKYSGIDWGFDQDLDEDIY